MDSSEDDDDFPTVESIVPPSKIDSFYQSGVEKGIRNLCCELLDLKDAVETLCGNNMQTKYLAFMRLSEEVVEMKQELIQLQKHISGHNILLQDLMTGASHKLDEWSRGTDNLSGCHIDLQFNELEIASPSGLTDHQTMFLDGIDLMLVEYKLDAAIEALSAEEKNFAELRENTGPCSSESSSYKLAILGKKSMIEGKLIEIVNQPSVNIIDLKRALLGLVKLGKSILAHQLLLKSYGSRLHMSIDVFLPSLFSYPKSFPFPLSHLVFSVIALTVKDSSLVFGDDPVYVNGIIQWVEMESEYFMCLVKETSPSSETVCALCVASNCIQASLSYCSMLESQGLNLSKLLLVLLQPYIEEVLEMNFKCARKSVLDVRGDDYCTPLSPHSLSLFSVCMTSSNTVLVLSAVRLMVILEDLLAQLTPLAIFHFGGYVLSKISQLFGNYMDALTKSIVSPSEEDIMELREGMHFRAETDSEQLGVLGIAFTLVDELLPCAVMKLWDLRNKKISNENTTATELKDWKRSIQHLFDKLRDHFCRQYVLSFIYSREGKTQLNAKIYLGCDGEDLYCDCHLLPSLPFQALFTKLQELATVAGDVLVGKEKLQKILLARLTETVVMWLSDENDFWSVFEDEMIPLKPLGLQQLILDMHFTVEIVRFAGYPSRHVHQMASAIIARVIRTFSARGIDPQSCSLPEDEWFVETAKLAINKLLLATSELETSLIDEHDIPCKRPVSDSEDTVLSSISTIESFESFASATVEELEGGVFEY